MQDAIEINLAGNGVDCPVVGAFLKSMKLRDEDLYYHCVQVGLIAEQVCMRLWLDSEKTRLIKVSGYLHDIGKLALSNEILSKRTPPDRNEWEQIQLHPELGANALADFEGFEDVSRIIRFHHEQHSGEGYPYGLKGDAIPYESRILRICDVFSAATSKRPYKPPYPKRVGISLSLASVHLESEEIRAVEELLTQVSIRR